MRFVMLRLYISLSTLIRINYMDDRTAAFLRQTGLIPTAAAARTLGVKTETLYAYVSRGLLTAHRASDSRESFFAPSDLRRLQSRPRRAAPSTPVSSAITLSRSDGIFYRGENVLELARTATFEQAAGEAVAGRAGGGAAVGRVTGCGEGSPRCAGAAA